MICPHVSRYLNKERTFTNQEWCRVSSDMETSRSLASLELSGGCFKINQYQWNPLFMQRLPHDNDAILLPSQIPICNQCRTTPEESAICLVSGELLWIRQRCCRVISKILMSVSMLPCNRPIYVDTKLRSPRHSRSSDIHCLYDTRDEDLSMQRSAPISYDQQRFMILEIQWLTISPVFYLFST